MNALPFAAALVVTVGLLGAVVVTGLRAARRAHLTLVACTVVSLAVTIYFAEKLGELYDLDAAGWITPVHLALAKVATLSYLAPIVTGVMTIRDARHRRMHGKVALTIVALTVLTAITGTWMVCAAEPLAP